MQKLKQALHRGNQSATTPTSNTTTGSTLNSGSYDQNVLPSAAQTSSFPSSSLSSNTQPGTGPLAQPFEGPALGVGNANSMSQLNRGLASSSGFNSGSTSNTIVQERTIVENVPATSVGSQTFVEQRAPLVTSLAPVVEVIEKAAVIQEVIKPGVREEIQPIVHREREQLEIREEIQPIYEKTVRPTLVEERQLAPEIRPEVRQGAMPVIAEGPRSSTLVEQEHIEVLTKAPIIEEIVHKKIIEEVQPVIYRETVAPKVIKEVQPIYEKIVEAPVVTYHTLPPRYASAVLPQQSVEQVVTTTTVVEKEFIPQNSSVVGVTQGLGGMKLQDQQRAQPGSYQYK